MISGKPGTTTPYQVRGRSRPQFNIPVLNMVPLLMLTLVTLRHEFVGVDSQSHISGVVPKVFSTTLVSNMDGKHDATYGHCFARSRSRTCKTCMQVRQGSNDRYSFALSTCDGEWKHRGTRFSRHHRSRLVWGKVFCKRLAPKASACRKKLTEPSWSAQLCFAALWNGILYAA